MQPRQELTIYLDNLASTPIDPRVAEHHAAISLALVGNPNSAEHAAGHAAHAVLADSRGAVGRMIGRSGGDVLFTPSASAALWLAVQDAVSRGGQRVTRVLASAVEHPSLLKHLSDAARDQWITLTLVPVNRLGQPDLDALRLLCREGVDTLFMMAANNELGSITPIEQVLDIATEHGAYTVVDASQAGGRLPLADALSTADQVILSGAKMYGPRTGALCGKLTRRTRDAAHTIFGTPDVPGAAAMALACDLRQREMQQDEQRLGVMRDYLERTLVDRVPNLTINGDLEHRLKGALHVSCSDIPGDVVIARLHGKVDLSTGAACQSGTPGPSHVLTAMKAGEAISEGAIRMCIGKFNTTGEVERAGALIASAMRPGAATWQKSA